MPIALISTDKQCDNNRNMLGALEECIILYFSLIKCNKHDWSNLTIFGASFQMFSNMVFYFIFYLFLTHSIILYAFIEHWKD